MSVQTDIEARTTKLQAVLSGSNEAITDKGGTAAQNLAGLPEAIQSMQVGNLMEGNVTPTGQEINLTPDDGYDGFSAVTVAGDDNLAPQNIADGITIYGVSGTLKVGASGTQPTEYDEYVEHAKLLYTGEYTNYAVAENDGYISVIFMTDAFQVVGYKADTTQYSAQGWVLCRYKKDEQNWDVIDHRNAANEYGSNYVKNIRFCTTTWNYNGAVIWPMSSGGGGTSNGGLNQDDILDLVLVPQEGISYIVPASGTLFYIGKISSIDGFENRIKKRLCLVKETVTETKISYVYVHKKSANAGDAIRIEASENVSMFILVKSGVNIVDYVYQYDLYKGNGKTVDFTRLNRFAGFCYATALLSNKDYYNTVVQSTGTVGLVALCTEVVRGWSLPGYLTGFTDKVSVNFSVGGASNAFSMLGIKLSSSGTPVYAIDDEPVIRSMKYSRTVNNGKMEFSAEIKGYLIIAGNCRIEDRSLLTGYTIIKEYTKEDTDRENPYDQVIFIAYKSVSPGETVAFTAAKNFSATFYQTYDNPGEMQTTVGVATREGDKLVFPLPGKKEILLGSSCCVYSASAIKDSGASNIYTHYDSSSPGTNTILADENTIPANGATNLAFPYTDSASAQGDVQGIWVKFKK